MSELTSITVTHKEIYERLVEVEKKVDSLDNSTKEIVVAFSAAKGAFAVLDWIAKITKPILWLIGVSAAFSILWGEFWKR
jgi:hypothetical protein